jgi:hypothetical protein
MSWAQWHAVGRALAWTIVTRIALFTLPWRVVSRYFERVPIDPHAANWERARHMLWAVAAVSRRILRDRPCLTQALVGQRLLRQCGISTDLRIGVARIEGEFQAHAWLELDDRVVLGGSSSPQRYTLLTKGMAGATL